MEELELLLILRLFVQSLLFVCTITSALPLVLLYFYSFMFSFLWTNIFGIILLFDVICFACALLFLNSPFSFFLWEYAITKVHYCEKPYCPCVCLCVYLNTAKTPTEAYGTSGATFWLFQPDAMHAGIAGTPTKMHALPPQDLQLLSWSKMAPFPKFCYFLENNSII